METCNDIRIITVPYDSGHRGLRMGGGPEHLLQNGLSEAFEEEGREARREVLHPESTLLAEVATAFELDILVSESVCRANEFALEDGLGARELEAALGMVRERFAIAAAGIASYDPTCDGNGRVLQAALACAKTLTS